MLDYIVEQYDYFLKPEGTVIIGWVTNDARLGWRDTGGVCIKRLGDEGFVEE